MKELLIVRSVSFQQIDLVLPAIRERFPDHRLVLLTHPHGVPIARKSPEFGEVLVYPHKGSFRVWRGAPELAGRSFEAVVVPVTSAGGGGFFNVFAFSFRIPAERRWMCLPAGDLAPLTTGGLLRGAAGRAQASAIAFVAVAALAPVLVLSLLCLLRRFTGDKR